MQPVKLRRIAAVIAILLGACLVSAGIGLRLAAEMLQWSGQFGAVMPPSPAAFAPMPDYGRGAVWNGELLYSVTDATGNASSTDCRIHGVNLDTGAFRKTDIVLPEQNNVAIIVGERRLWAVGEKHVYELDGGTVVRTHPTTASLDAQSTVSREFLLTNYFDDDGVLSVVRAEADRRFRLSRLIDGAWTVGPEVVLPGNGRVWVDDVATGRKVVWPRTSSPPSPMMKPASGMMMLSVTKRGGRLDMVFAPGGELIVYRRGFEFLDSAPPCASALAPQNAPPEVSGWEFVTGSSGTLRSAGVVRGRPYVSILERIGDPSLGQMVWLIRHRVSESDFEVFDEMTDPQLQTPVIVSTIEGDQSYIVAVQNWFGANVYAIEDSGLRRLKFSLPGCAWPMLSRYFKFAAAVIVAWLMHLALIVCGIGWLTRNAASREPTRVRLGSLAKRGLARGIDVAILLTPVVIHFGMALSKFEPVVVADELFQQEFRICQSPHQNWQSNYNLLILNNRRLFQAAANLIMSSLPWALALWFVFVIVEGRTGCSPGKWLVGLRTVRTTLRPCGVAQIVLRDVLIAVDMPLLLTPVPAAFSMALTEQCQRIGDWIAETVVVEAQSLREAGAVRDDRSQR